MADVEKLKEKRAQLDARIKRVEALANEKKRKEDTRRKIIAGGVVLAEALVDEKTHDWLMQLLERRVTKPADRVLFVLPATAEAGRFKPREDSQL